MHACMSQLRYKILDPQAVICVMMNSTRGNKKKEYCETSAPCC
jgi:hypothetical protein